MTPTVIHVSRAKDQPATKYSYELLMGDGKVVRLKLTNPPCRRIFAVCCKKQRIAANLVVHAYYDAHYYHCRAGKGCKA